MKKQLSISIAFFTLFLLASSIGHAQQSTRLSQYMFNPMIIHPAAAGNTGNTNITCGIRSLWNGVPGAPQTQYLTADLANKRKKIGVGLELQNDQAALFGQKKAALNLSYRWRTGNNSWFAVGANAGVKQHVFDGTKATFQTANDAAINTVYASDVKPVFGTGIYFFSKNQTFGLTVDNAIQYKIDYTSVSRQMKGQSTARLNLTGSQNFRLGSAIVYKQFVSLKYEYLNPVQVDITPMFEYQEKIALGFGYRHKESVSFIFQDQLSPNLKIGYAYDYQTNLLNSVSNGSHEFFITFSILRSKKMFNNPRYF